MASDLITGPPPFIKSEDGGSAAAKEPPTCSAELPSSASDSTHDLASHAGHKDLLPPHSSEGGGTAETTSADCAESSGSGDTGRSDRLTCGVTLSRTGSGAALAAAGDAAGLRVSARSDTGASVQAANLPAMGLNSVADKSLTVNTSSMQQLPRHLQQHLSSHTGQSVESVGSAGTATAGNSRPQTLLPTTLDLPFAEAVALLTNGFNREAGTSNTCSIVSPLPVSTPAQQSSGNLPTGALTSPLASPGVTQQIGSAAERRKQQKRLLKKLQSAVLEYHTRLGEECAVVASIRPENTPSLVTPEEARDVVIFGSQILENALQLQYDSLSHTIKQHSHHISMAASAAALSTSGGTPAPSTPSSPITLNPGGISGGIATSHLLPLPPRDVDLMNGNELKSYVPLLLRSLATGRARPMWGSPEHCPPWWPSDVPFRNVRMDTRATDARGDKTWSDCLRQAVKACFRFHGCEALLRDLPKESSNQKTPMVQVTLTPQKRPLTEPGGLSAKRSVSSASSVYRDGDLSSTHFNLTTATMPVAGSLVPGAVPLIPGAGAVSLANTALGNTLTAIPTNLPPGVSVVPSPSMQQLSLLPLTRQLRVHFKSRPGVENCEVISVHPALTCQQVLEHFGCRDSEYQLLTAFTGGSVITGHVWPVCDKQSDVYLVKRPDPLLAASSAM